MEITACPVCGSKNIGIGTLGDGIISGLSSWNEVCRNCGYQGSSLVFDSEVEYKKFIEALALQKKLTQIQESAKEEPSPQGAGSETTQLRKKSYFFEFIVSMILTIVFFMFLSISQYANVYSPNNLEIFLIYILGSFGGVFLLLFLGFIFVETLIRSMRKKNHR